MTALTTATETTTVPATFQAAPDAPCAAHPWCGETGTHVEHVGCLVQPPTGEAQIWWEDGDERPMILFGDERTDYADLTTGDQLRERAALWAAHAVRLGALADEFDAITEGGAPTTTATVMIGRGANPDAYDVDVWPVTGMTYAFEAVYNPDRISLADAESRVRALLAGRRVQVERFLNEDTVAVHSGDGGPAEQGATKAARQWAITTDNGARVSGHLPDWAKKDPTETVPADRLELVLSDLTHWTCFDGQTVHLDAPGFDKDRYSGPSTILRGSIDCRPYASDPAERVPLVNVELTDDHWINSLGPDGVADLAAKLRAQADRLTDEVLPALVAARTDWAKNGGQQ